MTALLLIGSGRNLSDLQRQLAARQPGWVIVRSPDASAAIDRLTRRPAQVVVASLGSVPECESLFSSVAAVSPGSIRLALSDSPQPSPAGIRGAHQNIAGRGDIDGILATVRAAADVAARCANRKRLQRILSRFEEVPSPPLLYFDIRDELSSTRGTAASMAEIASRDPALVARTLKIANSGYYARPRAVGDLTDAIRLLGTETLLGLVLAAHVYAGLPPPGIRLDSLWQHAFYVSRLAREIARIEGGTAEQVARSHVAGLLHDIGLLVLLQNEPARYQPLWRQSGGDESELIRLEREAFDVDHGELGATILTLWNLPAGIVDAVANSHPRPDARALPDDPLISRSVMAAEWLLEHRALEDYDDVPPALAATPPDVLKRWLVARDGLHSDLHGEAA